MGGCQFATGDIAPAIYSYMYVGFIWQNVKQIVEAHGHLVCFDDVF